MVSRAATAPPPRARTPAVARFEIDFRPGRSDLDSFPRNTWLRSLRRVLAAAPSERLGYLDGRGTPELREALSAYLDRVRGTESEPERMLIFSGEPGIRRLARIREKRPLADGLRRTLA